MSKYFTHDEPNRTAEKPHQFMNVEVRHSNGGISWFDGKSRKRGLAVAFQTQDIETTATGFESRSFMMFGDAPSMSFHVTTLERRTPKAAAALVDFVKPRAAQLAKLAMQKDWPAIDAILCGFARHDRYRVAA